MTNEQLEIQRLRGALLVAERFIAAELEVRKASYLPNPIADEQADLDEATQALSIVREALK